MPDSDVGHGHEQSHTDGPDWRAELRDRGYRLTPQRELILSAINELGHATPDEVLAHAQRKASSINASTVYRTLEVLTELGLVRHAHLSDRAPTYHSVTGDEHFHVKCRGCGEVTSVDVEAARTLVDRLEDDLGFQADVTHLAVMGRCRACREDARTNPSTRSTSR